MTFQAAGLMVTNGHDVNAYRFADTNLSESVVGVWNCLLKMDAIDLKVQAYMAALFIAM